MKGLLVCGCVIAFTVTASAGAISNSTTGLSSPGTTITFSEFDPGSGNLLTTEYSTLGVTFTNAVYDPQPGLFATQSIGNFSGPAMNPVTIFFASPVTDAAFQFITNTSPPDSSFAAFLAGSPVESFSAPTGLTQNWFGFTGIVFDEIQVSGGGFNGAFLLDNLEFNNAPEPSTLVLAGAALIGLLARRKIRK